MTGLGQFFQHVTSYKAGATRNEVAHRRPPLIVVCRRHQTRGYAPARGRAKACRVA